jgi:hypothetical protein
MVQRQRMGIISPSNLMWTAPGGHGLFLVHITASARLAASESAQIFSQRRRELDLPVANQFMLEHDAADDCVERRSTPKRRGRDFRGPASIADQTKVEIFQAACNTLKTVAVRRRKWNLR